MLHFCTPTYAMNDLKITISPTYFLFILFQAGVNSDEEDSDDDDDLTKREPSDIAETSTPKETDRLYPTAPNLDESDDSTASAHSTSV